MSEVVSKEKSNVFAFEPILKPMLIFFSIVYMELLVREYLVDLPV